MKPLRELLRPWKLGTFAAGMAFLIYGALAYEIVDWDIGVSVVMGIGAYIFAPLTVRSIWLLAKRPGLQTLSTAAMGMFLAWLVVDGSYVAYHTLAGNPMLRGDQWIPSLGMYLACGILWSFRGSARELLASLKGAFSVRTSDATS